MANAILFVGWNRAVVGREKMAMQLYQKSLEYYTKLKEEGKIESFEPVLLSAHGGDLNGFWLIKGNAQKLGEIREDRIFGDLIIEAGFCLEGFGVVGGFVGEGLTGVFSRWSKLVTG